MGGPPFFLQDKETWEMEQRPFQTLTNLWGTQDSLLYFLGAACGSRAGREGLGQAGCHLPPSPPYTQSSLTRKGL